MRTMTRKAISQLCIGLVGLPLVPAGMAMNARAATIYNEKHKPLPCNDLCRAWLGSHYIEDRTDTVVALPASADTNSKYLDQPVSSTVLSRKAVSTKRKQAEPLPSEAPMTASGDEGPTKKPALPLRRLSTRVMASVPLPVPRPMLLNTPVMAALPLGSIQVASREPPQETRPLDRTASVSTNDDHVEAVAPNAVTTPTPAPIGDIGREDRARPSDALDNVQVAANSPEGIAAVAELEARYAGARQHLSNMRIVYAALTGKLFPLIHLGPTSAARLGSTKDSTNGDAVAPLD